jgi:tetratricopeptide (TPR) repeat protein
LSPTPLLLLLTFCLVRPALAAQEKADLPPRPPLAANQDTNDANTYYLSGVSQLQSHPQRASDAFFWATRLNPALAEAWYGRWAALLLTQDEEVLTDYWEQSSRTKTGAEIHKIDSLKTKALLRQPLLYLQLDALVIKEWVRRAGVGEEALYGSDELWIRGWVAYSEGRFRDAERLYTQALQKRPKWYFLHLERGRAFLLHLQFDSALREMRMYADADSTNRGGGDDPVWSAESREMTRYTIGRVDEAKGDLPAARDIYTEILTANLGFYPAHTALARVDMAQGDSVAALKEYELATLVADAPTCYDFGVLLLRSNRRADAVTQFRRAIAADSDYAPPYITLAYLEETGGSVSAAAELYRQFVARAPRTLAPQITAARARLAALPSAAASH